MVLGGAAGWTITSRIATAYEAEAVLIVNQGHTTGVLNYEEILSSQELTTTYAELTTSRSVLEAAIAELGPAAPAFEDLQQQVRARAVPDTQLIVVTARAQAPGRAALLANAVANAVPALCRSCAGVRSRRGHGATQHRARCRRGPPTDDI